MRSPAPARPAWGRGPVAGSGVYLALGPGRAVRRTLGPADDHHEQLVRTDESDRRPRGHRCADDAVVQTVSNVRSEYRNNAHAEQSSRQRRHSHAPVADGGDRAQRPSRIRAVLVPGRVGRRRARHPGVVQGPRSRPCCTRQFRHNRQSDAGPYRLPPTARRPYPVDLLLCGHHYRVSQAALRAAGAAVYDETGVPITAGTSDYQQYRHHQRTPQRGRVRSPYRLRMADHGGKGVPHDGRRRVIQAQEVPLRVIDTDRAVGGDRDQCSCSYLNES